MPDIDSHVHAQPTKAITVIHCDPGDPNPNDNIPWPQDISPIAWNKLQQMVHYADAHKVHLTIEMTADWVDFALSDQRRIDSVHAWQARGHEIAAHHHTFSHAFWDGYTNIPTQTTGAHGAVYKDSTEVFYNQLRVLCSPAPLRTAGVGPAGTTKDSVAIEWSPGIIYQTTNRSGLKPVNNGGRFTDEAFSNVTHDTLYDPLRNRSFEVCRVSYCFLESVDSVNTIISKIDNSPFHVVGGVIHPFNYAASPTAFQAWIDSIAHRFPGQCKTVSALMQESSCHSQVTTAPEKEHPSPPPSPIFPHPAQSVIHIHVYSEKHQFVEASIYNLKGQKLKTVYSGYKPQGTFTLTTSIETLHKGTYLIKITQENHIATYSVIKY